MKKRITALALALTMVLGIAAAAAGTEKTISVTPMKMTINGQTVTPTKSDGTPAEVFAYDGATYVPLRYLSELLGIQVDWDAKDNTTAKLVGDNLKVPAAPAAGKSGDFTATAKGFGGDVTVTVTLTNGKITAVKAVGAGETPAIGGTALEKLPTAMVEANSTQVDGVSGATFTSKAVLEAAAAALKAAGVDPANLKPNAGNGDNNVLSTVNADVVVVGGGAAGMTAAIKAAEQGAEVLLVEKQAFLGGASAMASSGINAGGSDLQNATEKPYTAKEFYEYAKSWDYGYDRIGYRVVPVSDDFAAAFANHSATAANWIGSLGVEMKAASGSHSLQLANKDKGKFGEIYFQALTDELAKHKTVHVCTETKATQLLLDNNGAVKGVVVEDKSGSHTIEVKAVVLATGGYASADSDFWKTYAPEWDGFYSASAAGSTGDGIVMADAVGAQLRGMEAVTCTTVTVGEANKSGALAVNGSLKKGAVLLNAEGKRFVNETLGTADMMEALKVQPDQVAYLFADDTVLADNSDLQTVKDRGLFVSAGSLEELASKLGLDTKAVQDTFKTYAKSVAAGTDEFKRTSFTSDFTSGKTYYGVLVKSAKRICTGGIVTNGEAEVLTKDNKVIPGLYAAGETVAYGAHPLSAATIFGWIAGENAAEAAGK